MEPPSESLLARLRAHPLRAPETLAVAAARHHAPAAASWAAEHGADGGVALAGRAVRHHSRLARAGGAATGAAGFAGIVPDLVATAWLQSRLVLHVAAAFGFDPADRMRPAELLVLWELYERPEEAAAALDHDGTSIALKALGRVGNRDEQLVAVLARMAGKRVANRVGGRLVPGLGAIVASTQNAAEMRDLGRRATAFYGG